MTKDIKILWDVTGDIGTSAGQQGEKNIRNFTKFWSNVPTSYEKFNIVYDVAQNNVTMSYEKDTTS